MTVPSNPIQFTTLHGARPFVVCFGPDGGPFTLVSAASPLPVSAGIGTPSTPGDALATPSGIAVATYPSLYNGATWDLARSPYGAVGLPSAARTATVLFNVTNYGFRGIWLFLSISAAPAAPGAGGLTLGVYGDDPASTGAPQLGSLTAKVAVVGFYGDLYYPANLGASGAAGITYHAAALPRELVVAVTHADAQSYTYSVGYSFVN